MLVTQASRRQALFPMWGLARCCGLLIADTVAISYETITGKISCSEPFGSRGLTQAAGDGGVGQGRPADGGAFWLSVPVTILAQACRPGQVEIRFAIRKARPVGAG